MKRAVAIAPLLALAACAPAPTWQVVSLRTSEDQPATEASIARVRIDDQRFSGTTGCAGGPGGTGPGHAWPAGPAGHAGPTGHAR